jgi:hypothetical protein
MKIITRLISSRVAKALFALLLYPAATLAIDMPVGIPAPSFGLDEIAPAAPSAWPGSEASGYYYIDNTHPNATDSSNQYGYPDKPRASIPNYTSFPAGTYIEIHGGPYQGGQLILTFNCTQQDPCWFRGPDENNKPILRYETIVKGRYVILENLKYDSDHTGIGFRSHNNSSLDHAVFRNSEISGSGTAAGNHSAVSISGNSSSRFTDIVIYNNQIHDMGDHSPDAAENDYHGVHPDLYSDRVWILNNHIYRMGGDSVQVGRAQTDSASYSSHIYIGGNDFHDNHEDCIDIKKVNNVIMSENVLHDLPELGALIVAHDYPDHIWVVNNRMYNATAGVASVSSTNVWVVGNLIYNINHDPGSSFNPGSAYASGAAIHFRDTTDGGIVNNTIVRSDFGIQLASGPGPYDIKGNIIADRAEPDAWDIIVLSSSTTSITDFDYNIFTSSKINWADSSSTSLSAVQSSYSKCLNCESGPEHPQFINSALNNFDIGSTSSARDAGIQHSCYSAYMSRYGKNIHFSLDGSNRLTTGSSFDIGAYEYNEGAVVQNAPPNPPLSLTVN